MFKKFWNKVKGAANTAVNTDTAKGMAHGALEGAVWGLGVSGVTGVLHSATEPSRVYAGIKAHPVKYTGDVVKTVVVVTSVMAVLGALYKGGCALLGKEAE